MKKYYIIKRNSDKLIESYLFELSNEQRQKIEKRINKTKPLLLIEKQCNKDNSEIYTNLWTIDEGIESLYTMYTKGKLLYDYTGIITLVHIKENIFTFKQYSELNLN